jgi:uncharacterized membrane protein YkvA (DUF1232 family)
VRALLVLLRILRMRGVFSMLARLPQYLRLSWRLLWDSRVPYVPRIIVILAVLYGLSPFDIISEAFLPHIGFGEDLVLMILALRNLIAKSPPDIVKEHANEISKKS